MGNKNNTNLIIILLVTLVIFLLLNFFGFGFRSFSVFGGYNVMFILAVLAAIYVIYDVVVNNTGLSDGMKVLWIILALVFSIITAIIYYLVGRNASNDLFVRKKRYK